MKRQIRLGVFETNSSSEHSISIVPLPTFDYWVQGKMLARRVASSEDPNCWGNFWSRKYDWEFIRAEEKDKIEAFNRKVFEEWLAQEWDQLEKWKLESEPKDSEYHSYWDPAYYERRRKELSNATFEKITATDKFYNDMYVTWKEYIKALQKGDCYSPFKHVDTKNNIVVFGTYFHS